MKKIDLLLLSLLSMVAFAGCGKNEQPSVEPPPPPPIEIKLSKWLVSITSGYPFDKSIWIVGGNGGYRIVLPKKIELTTLTDWGRHVERANVDYSDEILALQINSNNVIVIELKLVSTLVSEPYWPDGSPLYFLEPYYSIEGYFMIVDSKGQKRIFMTGQVPAGGYFDIDEIEGRLLNDPNYWQE